MPSTLKASLALFKEGSQGWRGSNATNTVDVNASFLLHGINLLFAMALARKIG